MNGHLVTTHSHQPPNLPKRARRPASGIRGLALPLLVAILLISGCDRSVSDKDAQPLHPPDESIGSDESVGSDRPSSRVDATSDLASPSIVLTFEEQVVRIRGGELDAVIVHEQRIGDGDLSNLADLKELRELILDEGQPTARGIELLAHLPKLRHLRLRHTTIEDDAAIQIAKLKSLRILNLPQSSLSDRGLESLASLPNLELLRIDGAGLTLAGLESLEGHPTLRFLHLINASVGDDGLETLAQVPHLESLYLDGATISNEAWQAFFAARPNVHVHLDQFHHDLDPSRHEHSPPSPSAPHEN